MKIIMLSLLLLMPLGLEASIKKDIKMLEQDIKHLERCQKEMREDIDTLREQMAYLFYNNQFLSEQTSEDSDDIRE